MELGLSEVPSVDDRLARDLRLDSLALFELFVVLSEIDIDVPIDLLTDAATTIGMLHERAIRGNIDKDFGWRIGSGS